MKLNSPEIQHSLSWQVILVHVKIVNKMSQAQSVSVKLVIVSLFVIDASSFKLPSAYTASL